MRRIGLFILLLIVSLVLMEIRSAYEWNPFAASGVSGRVTDLDTGRPIADAVVISVWETYTMSGRFCFDSDSTRTDSQGRYALPSWERTWRNAMSMQDKTLTLYAYSPGYVGPPPVIPTAVGRLHHEDIRLERSDEARRRAGYLSVVLNEREGCRTVFEGTNDVHEDHFKANRQQMALELEERASRSPRTPSGGD